MKIRVGHVSNSSSSSFLIPINALKSYQIEMIKDHISATRNWSKYHKDKKIDSDDGDRWDIEFNEKCLYGYTFMDNFDMGFFLREIAMVDENYIFWEGEHNLDLDKLNREILQDERKEKLDNLDNL